MRRVRRFGPLEGSRSVTSRLRQPRARCRIPHNPAVPRRVMSCGEGSALVLWVAQAHPDYAEPRVPLLAPARGWDLGEQQRAFDRADFAAWPMPFGWATQPKGRTYIGRANVEPPPMRQRGVAGDLRTALADLPGVAQRRAMAKAASDERRRTLAEKGKAA